MTITAETVATLRERTGVGVMDAKRALEESGGDMDKAVDILRAQGEKVAEKKSDRATGEGLVGSYVHANGKIGVLVAVACETDFVARTDEFKELVKDIAMHIAAMAPVYISPDNIPVEIVEKERAIAEEQLKGDAKPDDIKKKIVDGKLEKYFEQVTLLKQAFIKDDSKTMEGLIKDRIQSLGENIKVTSFERVTL